MHGHGKEPFCFFGCAFNDRRIKGTLAGSENVENSPHTISDKEVAILRPGQLVRIHRAALHEKIRLGHVVEVRETALRAFLWERVNRVVKPVTAIHAIVRSGYWNAPHGSHLVG